MEKYLITYKIYGHITREIEAASADEALIKMKSKLKEADFGDVTNVSYYYDGGKIITGADK